VRYNNYAQNADDEKQADSLQLSLYVISLAAKKLAFSNEQIGLTRTLRQVSQCPPLLSDGRMPDLAFSVAPG